MITAALPANAPAGNALQPLALAGSTAAAGRSDTARRPCRAVSACAEGALPKGHALQVGRHRLRRGDVELARGIRAAGAAGGDIDVVRRRVIAGADAGAGIAVGHADEDAGVDGVDQRLIQGIELAADAAGAAAPGVVQHIGAVDDDVFQRLDALGVVEGAIVGDAVVEHPVAHDVGLGGHAADALQAAPAKEPALRCRPPWRRCACRAACRSRPARDSHRRLTAGPRCGSSTRLAMILPLLLLVKPLGKPAG